jgi:hypothetical protein
MTMTYPKDDLRCKHCGGRVETTEWYPIETVTVGDDDVELWHFCSEECRSEYVSSVG